MDGRFKWGAAGLILGLAVALSVPSFAQQPTPSPSETTDRTVTVTGSATIRSAPDEAVVTLGVETQAPTAQEVMQQNAAKMTDVIRALLDLGIGQDAIATTGINLWPNYTDSGRVIVSYTAQNQVSVTIRDMERIGRVIDTAVEAGANLTSGVMFQLSDENQGRDTALEAAMADARHKAEVLAAAGDASLGQVISIQETSSGFPPPVFDYRMAAAEAAVTPVSPPTLETQVTVTVVWALS